MKNKSRKGSAKISFAFAKVSKPRTKSDILGGIAASLELPRKQVSLVFDAVSAMIVQDLEKVGAFTLPGLAKILLVKKPATKERKGINPFTKEPTIFKAKPARKVVKIRALSGLKKAVN
jgi:DNA-binding protein HU-beta